MKNMNLNEEQKIVCGKYGASFVAAPGNSKVGVSKNVRNGVMPINGLRHPQEGDTTGWYIWAGDDYSDDPDFFVPLHVSHVVEWCPIVLKYLGLAPGWRFLVTEDYEDVWEDLSLLQV